MELFDHCFFRNQCVILNNKIHIKSLGIFSDRQLENMIIVDNNLYSFAFDINNGLPIIPFYDNKSDDQMLDLKDFLISIVHKKNFTKIFRYLFGFQNYFNENNPRRLIEKMHINYKSLNLKLFLWISICLFILRIYLNLAFSYPYLYLGHLSLGKYIFP